MSEIGEALEAARLAFAAATGEQPWDDLLGGLSQLTGGIGANLFFAPTDKHQAEFMGADGLPRESLRDFAAYYAPLDPRPAVSERLPLGQVTACHHFVSDAEVARSAFYNEFLMPLGLRYCLFSRFEIGGAAAPQRVYFGVHGAVGSEPFSDRSARRLQRLTPVLADALTTWSNHRALRRRLSALEGAVDRLRVALLVAEGDGRLVVANSAAEALLRAGDAFYSRHGRLHLRGKEPAFQRALQRAATDGIATPLNASGSGGTLNIWISRLPAAERHALRLGGENSVLILAADSSATAAHALTLELRQRYALTLAEVDVALAMAEGFDTAAIAERRHVSRETVRTQIRAVHAKMSVHSQADLTAAILRLPSASLRDPES